MQLLVRVDLICLKWQCGFDDGNSNNKCLFIHSRARGSVYRVTSFIYPLALISLICSNCLHFDSLTHCGLVFIKSCSQHKIRKADTTTTTISSEKRTKRYINTILHTRKKWYYITVLLNPLVVLCVFVCLFGKSLSSLAFCRSIWLWVQNFQLFKTYKIEK